MYQVLTIIYHKDGWILGVYLSKRNFECLPTQDKLDIYTRMMGATLPNPAQYKIESHPLRAGMYTNIYHAEVINEALETR